MGKIVLNGVTYGGGGGGTTGDYMDKVNPTGTGNFTMNHDTIGETNSVLVGSNTTVNWTNSDNEALAHDNIYSGSENEWNFTATGNHTTSDCIQNNKFEGFHNSISAPTAYWNIIDGQYITLDAKSEVRGNLISAFMANVTSFGPFNDNTIVGRQAPLTQTTATGPFRYNTVIGYWNKGFFGYDSGNGTDYNLIGGSENNFGSSSLGPLYSMKSFLYGNNNHAYATTSYKNFLLGNETTVFASAISGVMLEGECNVISSDPSKFASGSFAFGSHSFHGSHIEGLGNNIYYVANKGGETLHLEGRHNTIWGNQNISQYGLHLEGYESTVHTTIGSGGHVEGAYNYLGWNSANMNTLGVHIEGYQQSISDGVTYAAYGSHIEGYYHQLTNGAVVSGYGVHIEGNQTYISNGSTVGGNGVYISGANHIITDASRIGLATRIGGYSNLITSASVLDRTLLYGTGNTFTKNSSITQGIMLGSGSTINNTTAAMFTNIGSGNHIFNTSANYVTLIGNYNVTTVNGDKNTVLGNNNTAVLAKYNNQIIGHSNTFTTTGYWNNILASQSTVIGDSTNFDYNTVLGSPFINTSSTSNTYVDYNTITGRNSVIASDNSYFRGNFVSGYQSTVIAQNTPMGHAFLGGYQAQTVINNGYGNLFAAQGYSSRTTANDVEGVIISGSQCTNNLQNVDGGYISGYQHNILINNGVGIAIDGGYNKVEASNLQGTHIGGYSTTVAASGAYLYGSDISGQNNKVTLDSNSGGSGITVHGMNNRGLSLTAAVTLFGEMSTVQAVNGNGRGTFVTGGYNLSNGVNYANLLGFGLAATANAGAAQTILGKWNNGSTAALIVGNGSTSGNLMNPTTTRSNAFEVDWDGSANLAGDLTVHYGGSAYNVGACLSTASGGGGGSSSHTYSTTEQAVGTWIDGSTVYERTIVSNYMPYTSDPQIIADDLADWNIKMVVEFNPIIQQGFGEYSLSYSYAYQASDSGEQARTPGHVFIKTWSVDNVDKLCIIAYPGTAEFEYGIVIVKIRYTKTTT